MKIETLCRKNGVEFKNCGKGHLQLKGHFLVNYYPESKKRSAYVAGTTKAVNYVTPKQAVEMCMKPPVANGKNDKRSGNSRRKRMALLKRGVKKCRWCECPLTLDTSTIEHIIPLQRGGLDNANNRTLACVKCNQERGSDMPEVACSPQKNPAGAGS